MPTKVISIRLDPKNIAKARDGLLIKGIDEDQMDSPGKIVKLAFYYGLLTLCEQPKAPPTQDSLDFIDNLFNKKD